VTRGNSTNISLKNRYSSIIVFRFSAFSSNHSTTPGFASSNQTLLVIVYLSNAHFRPTSLSNDNMKVSMIQLAAFALALGVSAAPTNSERDCDLAPGVGNNSSIGGFQLEKAAAAPETTTKKSSKTTTTKASKAMTTDDSDSNASTTSDSGSEATATDTASSKAQSSAAATTTKAASTGSSGSSDGSLPASSGTSALSAVQTIAASDSFDGGMVMFDRGVSCTGQSEGGDSDAVFQIENGGSLSNVIIGPNQIEGIHCQGACTLTNVWWSAVCEDAFTIKNQDAGETTKIVGGGAFGADDKVMQHNGAGTLSISDFTVNTFGKLYRSCGNCDSMYERHVIMDGITVSSFPLAQDTC
jgi:hypothetical protein